MASFMSLLGKDIFFGGIGDFMMGFFSDSAWSHIFQNVVTYLPFIVLFVLGVMAIMGWGYGTTVHFSSPHFRGSGKDEKKQNKQPELLGNVNEDTVEPLLIISLIDLLKEAEKKGFQFTAKGSQHIFEFACGLRDAGTTSSIQFWGREKQRINVTTKSMPLIEIDPRYWQECKIDGMSCLEHLDGMAIGISDDNFQTVTESNTNRNHLYVDIHLTRGQAIRWLENQKKDSVRDVDLLDAIHYVMNREWGKTLNWQSLPSEISALKNALKEIRQKACDDELKVWGMKSSETLWGTQSSNLLIPIQPEYWLRYGIDQNDAMIGDQQELKTTQMSSNSSEKELIYQNLMTTKSIVEYLWPPENI